ncbi:sugar lactone lactonase YvrE [Sphingomonas jejuensis]|uniref:Sugar lactone lactonase YvrE n=1 Tax=Sphingomonas jejuensis TaxID=904715 RepID=A0ABX0XHB1_9SPHN|nr:SMP-30/gluconolactonase/LRE family protein [Sphingomonas jejuensis]NJC32718.1 sugar lactone lactonase YvrE [Sphingomonas jejuensis]
MDHRIIERSGRDVLGEGPTWIPDEDSLFWVDIVGQRLWSLTLADHKIRSWPMPEKICWVVPRAGRRDLLAGFKSGIAALTLDPLSIDPIVAPEADRPENRLNDAKVDGAGRLWFGSKDDRDEDASGAFYRMDGRLVPERVDDGYGVTNGPTFSADGDWLYHTDSAARLIYRFRLEEGGRLGPREDHIRFEDEWGYPDGMTTDADGCLWVAHWAGGRISRFDPAGRRMTSVALPAANITSCAFAGPALDRLFVTSAALNDDASAHGGALFEVDAGVRGMAPVPFGG